MDKALKLTPGQISRQLHLLPLDLLLQYLFPLLCDLRDIVSGES